MHSRGAFRGTNSFGDLLVRQSLGHPKAEDFTLRGRQTLDRGPQSPLCLVVHNRIQRVVLGRGVVFLDLMSVAPTLFRAPSVEQKPTLDREQPRPERALASKSAERVEGPNERVLYQFIHLGPLT